jgi:hypothetical protein
MSFESARIPDQPPAELLDAIDAAAEAYDRLHAAARHLHFNIDDNTGPVTVQLVDLDGTVLGTVPVRTVLDVASGRPLHGPH